MVVEKLITEHLDLWTTAIKRRSATGRGSSRKVELYGIKKLRQLILELAVHGLLVPQNPNDEPASELLKKIVAEKAKLMKEGKIKKEKLLPFIDRSEEPSNLPNGWTFFRISQVAVIRGGCTPSMAKSVFWGGDISWVSPKDMHDGLINDSELKVTDKALDESSLELIPVGSILIVGRSGILKRKLPTQITGVPCTINQDLKALTPVVPMFGRYLQLTILGNQTSILKLNVKQGTTVQSLVYETLFNRPFALPPLAEQHRIVAKVDELMVLCDQLEQQTDASFDAHQVLVKTLLNTLTSAADHTQFTSAWQHIAEHFDTLFTIEESIDQLKQAILQLAVMGKLVPQDPSDEPASELLKKIASEKAKLVKEGKIKKGKPLVTIPQEERPFELPRGWAWARFDSFGDTNIGLTYKPSNVGDSGIPVLRSSNVQNGRIDLSDLVRLTGVEVKESAKLALGDLLICVRNGSKALVGKTAQIKELLEPMCFGAFMAVFRSSINNYIEIFLNSPVFRKGLDGVDTTTINQLTQANLISTITPVPPLAEQHRIVAKVDELIALCDQLKVRLSEAQTTNLHLVDALAEQVLVET